MYSVDNLTDILDELCEELPPEVYRDLNGGISVDPGYKHNKYIPSENYWVMGEYITSPIFGRRIVVYHGSVMALHVDDSPEQMKAVLRTILRHELRHHLEGLAGVKDLEEEDRKFVLKALKQLGIMKE